MVDQIKIPKKGTAEYKAFVDARKKAREDLQQKEFKVVVDKVRKEYSKEQLLEIVQIQPFGHELAEFLAARKVLDELKVEYPMTFKVQCEERDMNAGFGKVTVDKPAEEKTAEPEEKAKETETPEEEAPEEKLTEAGALELSKDEQVAILEKLGAKEIPRYEKQRVEMILELQ